MRHRLVSRARNSFGRIGLAGLVVVALTLGIDQSPATAAPVRSHHPKTPTVSAAVRASSKTTRGPADDVVVNGWGDERGWHVEAGRGVDGYAWREVALLRPAGLDVQSWTGYQCVSGDGRYVAVAVEPTSVVNLESARDRGAFAYSVDLRSGSVRALAAGVGLKYFSPGCGSGDEAVFTLDLGQDDRDSELVDANLASGKIVRTVKVSGQITSTVPAAGGLVGVMGSRLVSVSAKGAARSIAKVPGDAYDVRPLRRGAVGYLAVAPGSRTTHAFAERRGKAVLLGSGSLTKASLFQGRSGAALLSGMTDVSSSKLGNVGIRAVDAGALRSGAVAASLDGGALLGDPAGKQTDPVLLATGTRQTAADPRARSTAPATTRGARFVHRAPSRSRPCPRIRSAYRGCGLAVTRPARGHANSNPARQTQRPRRHPEPAPPGPAARPDRPPPPAEPRRPPTLPRRAGHHARRSQ